MKNPLRAGLCALLVSACAAGGGDGESSGSSTPPVPLEGDAIPTGAVSFFKKLACPDGWAPFEEAEGRAIVSSSTDLARGATIGAPLASGEERKHTHDVSASVELPSVSYAGIAGCCNGGVGQSGAASFMSTTTEAVPGTPYVQLLACKKTAEPIARPSPLPAKMLMYFDLDTCPEGWKPAETTAGRLLVGLPQNAMADMPFGGEPLTSATPRTHKHAISTTLSTTSYGIALVAGGAASGYAKNGEYMIAGDTAEADMDIPVITLLQCQKE